MCTLLPPQQRPWTGLNLLPTLTACPDACEANSSQCFSCSWLNLSTKTTHKCVKSGLNKQVLIIITQQVNTSLYTGSSGQLSICCRPPSGWIFIDIFKVVLIGRLYCSWVMSSAEWTSINTAALKDQVDQALGLKPLISSDYDTLKARNFPGYLDILKYRNKRR